MIENRLKKGLGRGFSSLIGDSSQKIITNKVSINDLTRNKFQPRKNFSKESLEELTNSIKEQGVIQPIVVRPDKSREGHAGSYLTSRACVHVPDCWRRNVSTRFQRPGTARLRYTPLRCHQRGGDPRNRFRNFVRPAAYAGY